MLTLCLYFHSSGDYVDATDRRMCLLDDQLSFLSNKASSIQCDFNEVMSQSVILKDDHLKLAAAHAALELKVMVGEEKTKSAVEKLAVDHAALDLKITSGEVNFSDAGCSKFFQVYVCIN